MSRRPVLIAMLSLLLASAGGGGTVGDASAQAMSPAAPPAGSAPPAQSAVDPVPPASPASSPAPAASAPGAAAPPPALRRNVLDPKADSGRNDVLGRLLPKTPRIAGTDKVFPKADLAAPLADCPATRPTACSLDYVPVCAAVDTGVRCVTTPCPSTTRKTFGSACKACRAPNVTGYATGECPVP
jgi:hypothetical protein